jgi:hypothetical protein
MRYRGIIIDGDNGQKCFSIPFKDSSGRYGITAPVSVIGLNLDLEPNDVMVAEIMVLDGTIPIPMEEYLVRLNRGEASNLFVKALCVGKDIYPKKPIEFFNNNGSLGAIAKAAYDSVDHFVKRKSFLRTKLLSAWKNLHVGQKKAGSVRKFKPEDISTYL